VSIACRACGAIAEGDPDFCPACGEYLRWDPTGAHQAVEPAPPGAACLRAVHVDPQQHPPERLAEPEIEGVSDLGGHAERQLVGSLRRGDAGRHADVLDRGAPLHLVGGRPRRRDRRVLEGLEDDRVLAGGAQGRHLGRGGRDVHGGARRRRQPEADVGVRRGGRLQGDAEQLHQRHVQLVRDAVEPVDDHLGHPREQLDQRHPGVGDVVLGPLGAALRDPQARLVDEVLEVAVVELDDREAGAHGVLSSAGMT
jgi:hypothetical protein